MSFCECEKRERCHEFKVCDGKDGERGPMGPKGEPGRDGKDGRDGQHGRTPSVCELCKQIGEMCRGGKHEECGCKGC